MNVSVNNFKNKFNREDIMECKGKGGMSYKAGEGPDLATQFVVGHVDRVVVTIPVSRENAQSLVENFEEFKKDLSMKLAGKIYCQQHMRSESRFDGGSEKFGGSLWALT